MTNREELPIGIRIFGGSINGCDLDAGTGDLKDAPSVVAQHMEMLRGGNSPLPAHLRNLTCEVYCQLDSRLLRLEHFLPVAKFLQTEERQQNHRGIALVMGLAMAPLVAEFISTCFPHFRSPIVICGSNKRVDEAGSDGPAVIEKAIRCVYAFSTRMSMRLNLFIGTPAGITEFEPQAAASVVAHPELQLSSKPTGEVLA